MQMRHIFFTIIILFLFSGLTFSNSRTDRIDKKKSGVAMYENDSRTNVTYYQGPAITLQGPIYGQDYIIGPEILTSLSGFYDWQTNGDCKHFMIYDSPTAIHAVYMTSDDSSASFDAGRRTRYGYSTDGGATWLNAADLPNGIRSGYGYLTLGTTGVLDGAAIVGNHYGSPLTTYMHVDQFPLLGSFVTTVSNSPSVHIWPQCNATADGNVLVVGNTYPGGAAGDTVFTYRFNPTTNSWVGSPGLYRTAATDHTNMRWASATDGTNAVIILSTISDLGGSFGANRVFYSKSTDAGATWGSWDVLFDAQIDSDGDTSSAWLGLDVVYDNSGNFYATWNTVGLAGLFTTAKVWASKNGGTPVIVARNTDITGAMTTTGSAGTQANSVSMDWPSISASDDGMYVFCAYSTAMQEDTVNGFNSFNMYYNVSPTSALNFQGPDQPVQITSGIDDERYASLNRVALTDGASTYKLTLTYQKDAQPGSFAFSDNAPLSRASLIYREITQAQTVGILNIGGNIPGSYSLEQNYPNPFNPSTSIRFSLPKASHVSLKVFDISGKEVATLLNGQLLTAGVKDYSFEAGKLSSGIYFYTLETEGFKETKKMVLMK